MANIEEIQKAYNEVLSNLTDPKIISDWEEFERLTKERKRLEQIIAKNQEIQELKSQIQENQLIVSSNEEAELSLLAQEEISQLTEKKKNLEETLTSLIKKNEIENDSQKQRAYPAVIIEIRAGTGGDEAALFAGDLFRMYSRYAMKSNWKQKILDSNGTDLNGFKEIIFEIDGGTDKSVFEKMQFEGGVHRVQRIPKTEKQGRVHTSTASIAVLIKPKKTELNIKPDDLKIDFFRSSGPGGQNVNKRETAVRVTHLPTGIAVASQTERNQLQNKESAMRILEAKILERKQREEEEMFSGNRKSQIGKAQRVEKIRTYNFPQDRITDHRIKKSFHGLEEIMEGKLDKIIEALIEDHQKEEN